MPSELASRTPRDLSGLKSQLEELVEGGERALYSSGRPGDSSVDRMLKWLEDYHPVRAWAKVVVTRVLPERAATVNWDPRPRPTADAREIFFTHLGFAKALFWNVSAWEAEVRVFAEPSNEFVLVDADKPFSAWARLAALIQTAHSDLWVADPYLEEESLHLFVGVDAKIPLRLLGRNRPPALAVWRKFENERGGVSEYRTASKADMWHDRFLAIDGRVFLSGASFKDVGNRFSALVELNDPDNIAQVGRRFEALWGKARALA